MAFESRALKNAIVRPARDGFLDDVIEGLVNLGYNRNDARRAAERAVHEEPVATTPAAALRTALNILTGGR
jgi:Holliday junction resolvasome RuvABC DNA-binding subunit